jgi:hypothetical protein
MIPGSRRAVSSSSGSTERSEVAVFGTTARGPVFPLTAAALLAAVALAAGGCAKTDASPGSSSSASSSSASGSGPATASAQASVTVPLACSAADYCPPADWDTAKAPTPLTQIAPFAEPLNVVISAKSTVSLTALQQAMDKWKTVSTATSVSAAGTHLRRC